MVSNTSPSADTASDNGERELGFEFRGRAGEYFGIWIVNVLLSVITIGIYSAWAKVRRLRYFYGNTWLDGHNFEYHAKPRQILIGRLIVFGVLLIYNTLVHFSPAFGFLSFGFIFAFPWIINKAIRFNARMTSYRNVRFGFEGSYRGTFSVFLLWPVVVIFTLGIMTPFYTRAVSRYIYGNLHYGTAKFETTMPLSALYINFGLSALFFLIPALAVVGLPIAYALSNGVLLSDLSIILHKISFLLFLLIYISISAAVLSYHAGARNIVFNGLTLDRRHRFRSSLGRLSYCWVTISNLVVVVLTFFLMRPWAAIRSWRYLIERTSMVAVSDLGEFAGQTGGDGNVVAAEYADIEWVNIGL